VLITRCGTFVLLIATAISVGAQIPTTYNPRDEEYRLLGLIRAKAALEQAAGEFERLQTLHERSIVPSRELDIARNRMESARVDYLQASLEILFEQPHVLIEKAVKLRRDNGDIYVHLTLRNTAGSSYESETLKELIDPEILGQLEPERMRSIYVCLKESPGTSGAIISSPYEHRIAELEFGSPVSVSFKLLKDVDQVTVAVTYAARQEEKVVFLEKDGSADRVSIQSTSFSQESDLGGQAEFDLKLERFTDEANSFRLAVVGLPRDIRYEFRDPESGARLTQVRFPVGMSQRDLDLTLFLPQRAGGTLPREMLDRPLSFFVLAMDEAAAAEHARLLRVADDDPGDGESVIPMVEQIGAGSARLELIPRGVGEVEIQSPNLYHEIAPDEDLQVEVVVRNTGSRRLDGLRLETEAPLGWRAQVEPDLVTSLPVDAETRIQLHIFPPSEVSVGDYQVRLRASSSAADRLVESREATFRIHVRQAANPWLTLGLAVLLVGLVAGIVVFGVRLTRS